jgi:hypothetical protein
MEALNPRCFGVWGVIGKRFEVEKPNGVSAKCVILINPRKQEGGVKKKGRKRRTFAAALKTKYLPTLF